MNDELIVNNIPFVYHMVHKYYPTYANDEDVVQAGMLGLVKAAKNYDATKGKFSTYAGVIIKREIGKELKGREEDKNTLSLEGLIESNGNIV